MPSAALLMGIKQAGRIEQDPGQGALDLVPVSDDGQD